MKKSAKPAKITSPQLEMLPLFVALFATGIAAADLFSSSFAWVFLTLTIFVLLLSLPEFTKKLRTPLLFVGAIGIGIFYGLAKGEPSYDFVELFKLDQVSGRLIGTLHGECRAGKNGHLSFKMSEAVFEFDEQQLRMPCAVECRVSNATFTPDPEQKYSCTGKFSITQIAQTPVFNAGSLQPESAIFDPGKLTGKLQQQIRDGLRMSLPRRHAAIVTGFVLGDTSNIERTDRELFKETGISHLLAVSGQHLMVMIVLLGAILHWLKVPPLSRSLLILIILTIYAMTTAGSSSVWRALVMYLCVAGVLHFEASPSPIRAVAIAALALLLYDPNNLSNAAFQLSFTAVLGIVYLRRPIEKFLRRFYFPKQFARYLSATFAANIATMPMTALLFGTVSMVSLLVNPLILWIFGYILPASFLIVFLSILSPELSLTLAPALSLVIDGLLAFLQKAAGLPGHYFYVGNLSGLTIAAFFAASLYILGLINQRKMALALDVSKIEPVAKELTNTQNLRVPELSNSEKLIKAPTAQENKLKPPDYRLHNPFRKQQLLRAIDAMLLSCRRRPIKFSNDSCSELLPVSLLSIDNQNLYYQLLNLDAKSLELEPERILQAHVYLLALVGGEIINRIASFITPPPQPDDIRIEYPVRDRYLASAVIADSLLNSQLLTRASDEEFMLIIARAQSVYGRARNQLEAMITSNDKAEALEQHLSLRRDLLCWCREFIELDQTTKQKKQQEQKN